MNTVFPVGEFISDELRYRGWSRNDMAGRMSFNFDDAKVCRLELDLLIDAPTKGVILSEATAKGLARAFGTSKLMWLKLDQQWQEQK